ncbi:MAG: hypothetical protein P8P53_01230 [Tateyamaria sp.]|nr:hypothetical protein [Tateyamaria sp.]
MIKVTVAVGGECDGSVLSILIIQTDLDLVTRDPNDCAQHAILHINCFVILREHNVSAV